MVNTFWAVLGLLLLPFLIIAAIDLVVFVARVVMTIVLGALVLSVQIWREIVRALWG